MDHQGSNGSPGNGQEHADKDRTGIRPQRSNVGSGATGTGRTRHGASRQGPARKRGEATAAGIGAGTTERCKGPGVSGTRQTGSGTCMEPAAGCRRNVGMTVDRECRQTGMVKPGSPGTRDAPLLRRSNRDGTRNCKGSVVTGVTDRAQGAPQGAITSTTEPAPPVTRYRSRTPILLRLRRAAGGGSRAARDGATRDDAQAMGQGPDGSTAVRHQGRAPASPQRHGPILRQDIDPAG